MMAADAIRRFGTVKWFGGFNNKTQRENNFGFIQDSSGTDVYFHKGAWTGPASPVENELVTFILDDRRGKVSCREAGPLDECTPAGLVDMYDAIVSLSDGTGEMSMQFGPTRLRRRLHELWGLRLCNASPAEIQAFGRHAAGREPCIYRLVESGPHAEKNLAALMDALGTRITDAAPWASVGSNTIARYVGEIIAQFDALNVEQLREKCLARPNGYPLPLIVYMLERGACETPEDLGSDEEKLRDYIDTLVAEDGWPLKWYRRSGNAAAVSVRWTSSNPVLARILAELHFLKCLAEKNNDFAEIYGGSKPLPERLDTFILHQLFSLVVAGNPREVVFAVFIQRLWQALTSKAYDLDAHRDRLLKLFPSCLTLGPRLSCEAVYWEKEELFLCRGKRCRNQQVLPRAGRPFSGFSLYDWMHHYGIDYLNGDKPQARDFPIKIAGYFNRLQEIFRVLHCDDCGELLIPDLKYARTEFKEIRNGVVETQYLAAAYRLTVFHCNNQGCGQHNKRHYINHCIGFGCNHIIDSRRSTRRCSEGRYVCKRCGSCCIEHGRSNPVGLCADCGAPLKVIHAQGTGRHSYAQTEVICSETKCGFRIDGRDRPAKFSRFQPEGPDPEQIVPWYL